MFNQKFLLIILSVLFTFPFLIILNFSLLFAETIIVDTTGTGNYLTIQEGIDASTDGDTVLVHPATYTENIDFTGKNIVVASLFLISEDANYISQTIIDGNQNGSVVSFANSEDSTAVLMGFTLINGSYAVGGGIFCNASSPKLEYLVVTENTANVGGGIICIQSNTSMKNLTIYGNSGSGVACNSSNISLDNCILWNDSPGEIIFYSGTLSVNYSNIQGGWIGEGNIDEDPQFVNTAIGNFNLTENSPCINTGNPFFPPDPDGTRPDMGAFYYYNDASEIVAEFCADSTVGFSQLIVQFTNLSAAFNCEITSWDWDFGDGETSIDQNPIHDYNSGGFYTVCLTVEGDNGNSETETKEDYIIVYTVIEDSASISGTWFAENSPYLVQGRATVPEGQTLTIEPGTLIQLYTGSNATAGGLVIDGTIIAQGAINDTIVFTRYGNNGNWITLNLGFDDSLSSVSYCKFEYGCGIGMYRSSVTIENCLLKNNLYSVIICASNSCPIINNNSIINNNECGIYIVDSNPTIMNNIIKDNGLLTDYSGIICSGSNGIIENNIIQGNGGNGIHLPEYSSPLIKNNTIDDNGYPGIYCGYNSSPHIENNTIIGNQWGGVYCEFENNPFIINNIIKENEWGIYCLDQGAPLIIGNLIIDSPNDGICCDNASPIITNNTIVYNGLSFSNCAGIFCADNSDPIIYNTILWENSADFDYSGTGANPIISYSLIQGSSLPSWVQDGGNNIFSEDPLFLNEISRDFRLTSNSPCIDTGTPDTTGLNLPEFDLSGNTRIYNDIIDRGAYEWQGYGVDEPDEFNSDLYLLQNKPNPFCSFTAITFMPLDNERIKDYSLSIYNIKGQLIKKYNNEGDSFCEKIDIVWDGTDMRGNKVPSGVYFYKLSCGGYYVAKKMLLIR